MLEDSTDENKMPTKIHSDAIPVLYHVRDISKLDCDKKYSLLF